MEDNIQEDINRERRQELQAEKQKEMEGQIDNQGTEASQSQKKLKISSFFFIEIFIKFFL